jgi:uncharacterized protein YbcI
MVPEMEAAQTEIEREIERVHEEAYGGGFSGITVHLIDDAVLIIVDVEFTRAEQTLVDAGNGESVRETREAFQSAIAPTFTAIVERATGRTVRSFASRMIVSEPPWAAEVFRLAPASES